ncbi:PD-(D/E)XK nuclease family protein [Poriferisphaera sp. WC338]|uniref:PD-(D/E)XK nuclease family protein n=1 Tax=Poriferisphaera sp. WC338 TaxID=3425129 RepID=UPI003D81BF83
MVSRIETHTVDWNEPVLAAAAQFLRTRYTSDGIWDMSEVVVVTAAARAGRRLTEVLVSEAENAGAILFPPEVVTAGGLPEYLYKSAQPMVSGLEAKLLRTRAIMSAGEGLVESVVGTRPGEDEFGAWWAMAEQLGKLSEELAAGSLRVNEVTERCEGDGFDLSDVQRSRWEAAGALDELYHDQCAAVGVIDRQRARLTAIEDGTCRLTGDVVMIAMPDQSTQLESMLKQAAAHEESAGDLIVVTHASEEHEEGFHLTGGLDVSYWSNQHLDMNDQMIHVVGKENEIGGEVVRLMAEAGETTKLRYDQITVGLGHEEHAGAISRALDIAGAPNRYAGGRRLMDSPAVVLLAAMGRYAEAGGFDQFAAILRHPDLQGFLSKNTHEATGGIATHDGVVSQFLAAVDRYATEHLPRDLGEVLMGDGRAKVYGEQVLALRAAVDDLLPRDRKQPKPISAWSSEIAAMMRHIYGHLELRRYEPSDEPIYHALRQIADALRQVRDVGDEIAGEIKVTFGQAVNMVLSLLRVGSVPEMGGDGAVELMGLLDLPLDDAPVLIMTGMNEGYVPASRNADAFLPDGLRQCLGLGNNRQRYARDLLLLNTMVKSKQVVRLVLARQTAQGDPLAPSRLLFACNDQTMIQRVNGFYEEHEHRAPVRLLRGERKRHGFLIPPPLFDEPVLKGLGVTAFRQYLQCPYRFYLKYVRRLQLVNDAAVELDGAAFGTLAHGVLEAFGKSDMTGCEDVGVLRDYLSHELDVMATTRFGQHVRPAVRVQVEQLRERLMAFALQQVVWTQEGWQVRGDLIEHQFKTTIEVDGEPFEIRGKIDRVDEHPEYGLRLLDYKTSDIGKHPEQVHRKGRKDAKSWIDFQLPLYEVIARGQGLSGQMQMGYVNLPRKSEEAGMKLADWSDEVLVEAREACNEIIRQVRGRVFWPPAEVPVFDDGMRGLCGDGAFDREGLIMMSEVGEVGDE